MKPMMHADELIVSKKVACTLVADQFPQWAHLAVVEAHGSGTDNTIYRIGDELAARFPRRNSDIAIASRLLEQNATAMTEFAAISPFPSPQPVAIGQPGGGFPLPWSIQTWLPGHVATPGGLADSQSVGDDLARLIGTLRTADPRGRHFAGHGRGGNLPDHDAWMSHCFAMSEDLMDVSPLQAMWQRLRTLPRRDNDVMTHGDLIPANLLVMGGRLVGVLDTGGFAAADPALDLVAGWHLLDRDRRGTLRTALRCDSVQWLRGAAWALQQAMGLIWYYRTSNPVSSELGRSTLDRLLNDAELTKYVRA
jgi:aminoglycoside phosphotransferase (APT) family kinase protein